MEAAASSMSCVDARRVISALLDNQQRIGVDEVRADVKRRVHVLTAVFSFRDSSIDRDADSSERCSIGLRGKGGAASCSAEGTAVKSLNFANARADVHHLDDDRAQTIADVARVAQVRRFSIDLVQRVAIRFGRPRRKSSVSLSATIVL